MNHLCRDSKQSLLRWFLRLACVQIISLILHANDHRPIKIAEPLSGHIHPSICMSKAGTLIVTFGRVNHRDLRILRSHDAGKTWSHPEPFQHTTTTTHYPGSLTALSDGRIVHCWNRWEGDSDEKEPRRVLFSTSSDEGVTWTAPQSLPYSPERRSVIRHPLVEITPSRWLCPLDDATLDFDATSLKAAPWGDGRNHGLVPIVRTPKGTHISGAGLRSTDSGTTWLPIEGFPDIKSQGWRHELVCLSDGLLLASEITGPGFGGEKIAYRVSADDGLTWSRRFVYHDPGRAIGGRACPRTVEIDKTTIGVVFYDTATEGGPSLLFLTIPVADLTR